MLPKTVKFFKQHEKDLIIAIIIVMVSFASFGLGRLSKISENKIPISVENLAASAGVSVPTPGLSKGEDGALVASKNGTKYHFPWCPGALTIKEENKIWFSNKEEAEKAGYTPAANCKGL